MKYKDEEKGLYVVIDPKVIRQIEEQAVGGFPNENGGMLAGIYSDDKKTVTVMRVIVPSTLEPFFRPSTSEIHGSSESCLIESDKRSLSIAMILASIVSPTLT